MSDEFKKKLLEHYKDQLSPLFKLLVEYGKPIEEKPKIEWTLKPDDIIIEDWIFIGMNESGQHWFNIKTKKFFNGNLN